MVSEGMLLMLHRNKTQRERSCNVGIRINFAPSRVIYSGSQLVYRIKGRQITNKTALSSRQALISHASAALCELPRRLDSTYSLTYTTTKNPLYSHRSDVPIILSMYSYSHDVHTAGEH